MKIVKAINSMIEHEDKISNVVKTSDEYFFVFNKKHKWSIAENNSQNDIALHYYPDEKISIEELSQVPPEVWEHYNYVTFKASDIKTQEALESFNELYQLVKSKVFGVDSALDEIIQIE